MRTNIPESTTFSRALHFFSKFSWVNSQGTRGLFNLIGQAMPDRSGTARTSGNLMPYLVKQCPTICKMQSLDI